MAEFDWRFRLSIDIVPIHYNISLVFRTPPFPDNRDQYGLVFITLKVLNASKEITLHKHESVNVKSVRLYWQKLAGHSTQAEKH
jgi:hypothetical protein